MRIQNRAAKASKVVKKNQARILCEAFIFSIKIFFLFFSGLSFKGHKKHTKKGPTTVFLSLVSLLLLFGIPSTWSLKTTNNKQQTTNNKQQKGQQEDFFSCPLKRTKKIWIKKYAALFFLRVKSLILISCPHRPFFFKGKIFLLDGIPCLVSLLRKTRDTRRDTCLISLTTFPLKDTRKKKWGP